MFNNGDYVASTDPLDTAESPQPKRRKRTTAQEHGFMRGGCGQGSDHFLGSASGIHFIRNVSRTLARNSASIRQGLPVDDDLVPGEDDQLQGGGDSSSRPEKLWQADEVDTDLQESENAGAVPFDCLVEWTKSYFETWHPAFPFLHAPSILQLFDQISNDGISNLTHIDATIVRSIMSISAADKRQIFTQSPDSKRVPVCLVFQTVEEALASLKIALCRPTSVRVIQAAVSVQLFLVLMLRYNSACRVGGLVVRMAFLLGLHRCPARFSTIPPSEKHIRRRLFWSIYCLDRHLSQSLGLPIDIRDDDVDVCYPCEEVHSDRQHQDIPQDPPEDGRLQLLNFLAKYARIKGMILELRNKSVQHRQANAEVAMLIQAELAKWSNEMEDFIDLESPGSDILEDGAGDPKSLQKVHRLLLLVSKQESIISLNRPLLASEKSTASYAAALHECIGASQKIISALKRSLSSAALLWPSLTWAVWMSCFVLMYAASEGQFPMKSALRNIDSSLEILSNISRRRSFWPEACAATLRDLRSSLPQLSKRSSTILREQQSQLHHSPSSQLARSQRTTAFQTFGAGRSASTRQPGADIPETQSRAAPSDAMTVPLPVSYGSPDEPGHSRASDGSSTESTNAAYRHRQRQPATEYQQTGMLSTPQSVPSAVDNGLQGYTPDSATFSQCGTLPDRISAQFELPTNDTWHSIASDGDSSAGRNSFIQGHQVSEDPFTIIDIPNLFAENFMGISNSWNMYE